MRSDEYKRFLETYKTSFFVVLVLATIAMVYNKLVLNDSISQIIYAGVIGYFVSLTVNVVLLKRIVFRKKK